MQYQFKKILITEFILLLLAFFHFFIFQTSNNFFTIVEFAIITIFVYKLFKIDKRKERITKDLFLLIIIVTISYYVITYFLGFFIGFVYSNYSRTLLGIARNIFSSILLILFLETIRECIIKNAKYYSKLIILSVFVFSLLDITTVVTLSNLHSRLELVKFIMTIVIPYFSKNIFLTYATYYTDKTNSIIYSLIMTLPKFILPVLPDLGDYIMTLLLTIIPILIMVLSHQLFFYKREKIENSKKYFKNIKFQKLLTGSLITTLLVIIYLVGGFGRFQSLAIGSGSMAGTINKGDVVIIDKKDKDYKKNDIIAFSKDGEIIIHRIVKIIKKENKLYYQTKGDANNGEDAWLVDPKTIVGKKKIRILFIGIPTIKLSEFIHR